MTILIAPDGTELDIGSAQKIAELVHCHGYRLKGSDPVAESVVEQPERHSTSGVME